MRTLHEVRPVEILLVEDDPSDAWITSQALADGKVLNHVTALDNGEAALAYLRQEGEYRDAARPDLVLLDLNLPRKSGHEVLAEIKQDPNLWRIPVVILTTSDAEADVLRSYNGHANCFITKPLNLDQFTKVVQYIDGFWLSIVKLPRE